MRWVSLHTHSCHSHGDGHRPPSAHVARVVELGMSALALTEHRNTSSHVQLEAAARTAGIKPIFGCEFDVALPHEPKRRHFHQTVLAMDEQGYRSLNHLVTLAWKQTKYVPRLSTQQLLDGRLTRGLVVLSGCADSWLSCTLLGGKSLGERRDDFADADVAAALTLARQFQDVYGDRYYLEVQQFPGLERSCILNQVFCDIAATTGIEPVVTADVHYPYPDDNVVQRMLHAAHRGGTVATMDAEWEYGIRLTYPTSDQQVLDNLVAQQLTVFEARRALANTEKIAARCTVELPRSAPVRYVAAPHTPEWEGRDEFFEIPAAGRLREWVEDGIDQRMLRDPAFTDRWRRREDEYVERIRYEFGLIESKGFPDYFLVVADLVQWAKDVAKMAVGPGRGSVAASLLAYLLRITEIDPMIYPEMLFERFIDPTRPDEPDIDIDFSRPGEAFAYLAQRYGDGHVAHVGNFVRYRGRMAINDVGKAYTLPTNVRETMKRFVVDRPDNDPRENYSVRDAIDAFPEARKLVTQYPELEMATRIEGDYRGLNVHAAGAVVSNRPIAETCALYTKRNAQTGEYTTVIAYDKRDAEALGMLKIDMLGLSTMAAIEDVVAMVDGLSMDDINALTPTDEVVLAAFSSGDLTGIFQFEGRVTRSIVRKIFGADEPAPADIMTLADINALSRPGALLSGMTERYVKVENGRAEPKSYHRVVDTILSSTNGCLVYQEQVMMICRDLGGMPGEKVGAVRRIIGKKKGGGAFDEYFAEFAKGARDRYFVKEADARKIWDFMATSSSYLFNVPHAVSYATIGYWLMWCKVYHPLEFYVAVLRQADKDHTLELLQDALRHGITTRPPSLHNSGVTWTRYVGKILAGFSQVDGIGEKRADACVAWRDTLTGPPPDDGRVHFRKVGLAWSDMRYVAGKTGRKTLPDLPPHGVKGIGPAMIAKIEEFCASDDPFRIHYAGDAVAAITRAIHTGELALPDPDADAARINTTDEQDVVFVGLVKEVIVIDVLESERRRSNRTISEIRDELPDPHLSTRAKLICIDGVGIDVHVNVHRYLYPRLADDLAEIVEDHDLVHVMGTAREGYGPTVQARMLAVLDPVGEAPHAPAGVA